MKRCIAKLIVFLLLGAILNVAVAWGCALCFGTLWSSSRPATSMELRWITSLDEALHAFEPDVETGFGRRKITVHLNDPVFRKGIEEYEAKYGRLIGTFAPVRGARRLQAGFPLIALESFHLTHTATWEKARGMMPGSSITESSGGWLLSPDSAMSDERSLPVIPVWPGFAINTLFYAAILWGLFAAPFALRRRRRIKRGLCPGCAYPIGDSPVCTECGTPVAKHKAQTQKAEMT